MHKTLRSFAPLLFLMTAGATTAAEPADSPSRFPDAGLVPRVETGAQRFLDQHPTADGRGVVIAVFDSGVDPGVPLLRTTTDGRPKVIDVIDATGSGDVTCSIVRTATDGKLIGLSERELTLPEELSNPEGTYNLGLAIGFDLFAKPVVKRLKEERKRELSLSLRLREERLIRSIAEFPSTTTADQKQELNRQLDVLRKARDTTVDPGPVYDCLTYHDGKRWRALIDTDADGDLRDEHALTDFDAEPKWGTFGPRAKVNFGIHLYNDGQLLSIVVDSGMHGTHVAGIIAAHAPDAPERNGLAPGAQIVSVKIGDTRLDGMETGKAILRGLEAVRRHQCDLINMSYGESTFSPNHGFLIEQIRKTVDTHDVLFISSAGNSGPALSTVGAPGGTSDCILGIGACVPPEMMAAEYGLERRERGAIYTWSSRGPTADGANGVDLLAPGGAISTVPASTLKASQQANGTSMASPNACGGIALLVSHLKQTGKPFMPQIVRQAVLATAVQFESASSLSEGAGLLQVDKAAALLDQLPTEELVPLRYRVACSGAGNGRGIIVSRAGTDKRIVRSTVSVKPQFKQDADARLLAGWERKVLLRSNADWVSTGEALFLTNDTESFDITVDTSNLPGSVRTAEVVGIDANFPEGGPLFRVPITALLHKPLLPDSSIATTFTTIGGDSVHREFYRVPDSGRVVELTVRRYPKGEAGPITILTHLAQTLPDTDFRNTERRQYLKLDPGESRKLRMLVEPGAILEVAITPYWTEPAAHLLCTIRCDGLSVEDSIITLTPLGRAEPIRLRSDDARDVAVAAVLNRWQETRTPKKQTLLLSDDPRDRLNDGDALWKQTLEWSLSQKSQGSVKIEFPVADGLLYGSPVGSHIWQIHDSNGALIVSDDVYPSEVELSAGEYTLSLEMVHADREQLERRKAMPVQITRELPRSISIPLHRQKRNALNKGTSSTSVAILSESSASLWPGAVDLSALPETIQPGDTLVGTFTVKRITEGVTESSYLSVPIDMLVPGKSTTTPVDEAAAVISSAADLDAERIREAIARLRRIEKPAVFEQEYARLRQIYPNEHELLQARLHFIDQDATRKQKIEEVIQAADVLLSSLDENTIRLNLSRRAIAGDKNAAAKRKRADKQRSMVIDALYRKGRAIGYRELDEVIARSPIIDPAAQSKAFEDNYARLAEWIDPEGEEHYLLAVRRERRQGRFAKALQILNKHHSSKHHEFWPTKKRADLYSDLQWDSLAERERHRMWTHFPTQTQAQWTKKHPANTTDKSDGGVIIRPRANGGPR